MMWVRCRFSLIDSPAPAAETKDVLGVEALPPGLRDVYALVVETTAVSSLEVVFDLVAGTVEVAGPVCPTGAGPGDAATLEKSDGATVGSESDNVYVFEAEVEVVDGA
jgi:hypothetical protein